MRTLYSSTRASLDQVIDFQPIIETPPHRYPPLFESDFAIQEFKSCCAEGHISGTHFSTNSVWLLFEASSQPIPGPKKVSQAFQIFRNFDIT